MPASFKTQLPGISKVKRMQALVCILRDSLFIGMKSTLLELLETLSCSHKSGAHTRFFSGGVSVFPVTPSSLSNI